MPPLHATLVWGAGGHGKVVADLIRVSGGTLAGFIDRNPDLVGRAVGGSGAEVVGIQAELLDALGRGTLPHGADHVALGIGDNRTRLDAALRLSERCAPPLVHPRATVASSVDLEAGVVVFAGAVVNADARLGRAAIVNSSAVVEHDCRVGPGAHVSPGAVLAGEATIAEGAWVGAGAVVLPGVHVGPWAIVGAGAVVVSDVDEAMVVVGNPARLLRRLR